MKQILPALLIFTCYFAQSQEIELDPITVTATLSQKRSSETGRNITIIKGENFKNLPVHSLDELLRYVPGVEIQARGPMGSQSDIVLRGGTYQQVLVILDGMRLNDPNTGHFNSYIPIAPAEIDRIEILKGASSALYGPDAVGGVIYVFTKTFTAKQDQDIATASAGISAGQYGYMNADAGMFYSKKNFSVSGGVITNNADGVQQRGIKGYFHNTTASVSAKYYFSPKWDIAYRYAYDNRDFAAQNFYTTSSFDTANEKVSSHWQQLSLGFHTQKQQLKLDAGFKRANDKYQFAPASTANANISKLFQALLQYQYELAVKTTIITGVNYQQKIIRSNDRGNHDLFLVSPFISLSHQLARNLYVHPSLQWVAFRNISSELVPQLDISYKNKGVQLRGSVGKTIRDADFTERYNNYNASIVKSGGSVGNPDLKAERSVSYEAGADWFLKSYLKVSATFFQRFHQRLIDYTPTPYDEMPRKENLIPTGTYALAKNIASVNTTGFETDIQFSRHFSEHHHFSGSAGIVWLDSKSSDGVPSIYVSSHAKFLTNFSIIYQYEDFSLSLNGLYKHRSPQATSPSSSNITAYMTPDYFAMNARLEYGFYHKSLAIFTEIDNVFDRHYSDRLGAVMPGSWFIGGIKFQWAKKQQ